MQLKMSYLCGLSLFYDWTSNGDGTLAVISIPRIDYFVREAKKKWFYWPRLDILNYSINLTLVVTWTINSLWANITTKYTTGFGGQGGVKFHWESWVTWAGATWHLWPLMVVMAPSLSFVWVTRNNWPCKHVFCLFLAHSL